MKEFTILKLTNAIYTEMRVLIWCANGLSFPNLIEHDASQLLSEIIQLYGEDNIIYLNFINITQIDDHALDSFIRIALKTKKQIVIYNISSQIKDNPEKSLRKLLEIGNLKEYHFCPEDSYLILGKHITFNQKSLENKVQFLKKKKLEQWLRESFTLYSSKRRMLSTPIMSNGEFDAKKIITNQDSFLWTTLLISDKVEFIISNSAVAPTKLMSVSLRSSPFTSCVAQILSLDFDIIDHFGPNFNLIEEEISGDVNSKMVRYIYVGDFTIGGTEIKLAQLFCQLNKCILKEGVVIGSALETKEYSNFIDLESLIVLSKIKKTVKYKF